jgi:hypothetical protein
MPPALASALWSFARVRFPVAPRRWLHDCHDRQRLTITQTARALGLDQIDVGEQRRNHRPLPRPLFTDCDDPVFQHARLEPFLDQTDNAWVGERRDTLGTAPTITRRSGPAVPASA